VPRCPAPGSGTVTGSACSKKLLHRRSGTHLTGSTPSRSRRPSAARATVEDGHRRNGAVVVFHLAAAGAVISPSTTRRRTSTGQRARPFLCDGRGRSGQGVETMVQASTGGRADRRRTPPVDENSLPSRSALWRQQAGQARASLRVLPGLRLRTIALRSRKYTALEREQDGRHETCSSSIHDGEPIVDYGDRHLVPRTTPTSRHLPCAALAADRRSARGHVLPHRLGDRDGMCQELPTSANSRRAACPITR